MIYQREEFCLISFRKRNEPIFDFDDVFFDRIDFIERDHIGFMDAADDFRRDLALEFGKGLKRHNPFIDGVNPPVIAHSFDENYFPQKDFFETVFGLDENEIAWRSGSLFFR